MHPSSTNWFERAGSYHPALDYSTEPALDLTMMLILLFPYLDPDAR